jgi:hypothetical protein
MPNHATTEVAAVHQEVGTLANRSEFQSQHTSQPAPKVRVRAVSISSHAFVATSLTCAVQTGIEEDG